MGNDEGPERSEPDKAGAEHKADDAALNHAGLALIGTRQAEQRGLCDRDGGKDGGLCAEDEAKTVMRNAFKNSSSRKAALVQL